MELALEGVVGFNSDSGQRRTARTRRGRATMAMAGLGADVACGSKDFREEEGFGFSAASVTSLARGEKDVDILGTCAGAHDDHHGADVGDMDPETQALLDEFKIGVQEDLKISFDRAFSRTASRLCQGLSGGSG